MRVEEWFEREKSQRNRSRTGGVTRKETLRVVNHLLSSGSSLATVQFGLPLFHSDQMVYPLTIIGDGKDKASMYFELEGEIEQWPVLGEPVVDEAMISFPDQFYKYIEQTAIMPINTFLNRGGDDASTQLIYDVLLSNSGSQRLRIAGSRGENLEDHKLVVRYIPDKGQPGQNLLSLARHSGRWVHVPVVH